MSFRQDLPATGAPSAMRTFGDMLIVVAVMSRFLAFVAAMLIRQYVSGWRPGAARREVRISARDRTAAGAAASRTCARAGRHLGFAEHDAK
jgi:hypothetical protein